MKSLPIAVLIPLLLFAVAPSDALAGKRSLWNGLVTFNQPAKATVQEIGGAGWDESFSVTPRQSGQNFRGVTWVVQKRLGPRETAMSNRELAQYLKKVIVEGGTQVQKFKYNAKKESASGLLSGKVKVSSGRAKLRVKGEFRLVRVAPSLVVGAIALSPAGEFGKPRFKPWRQIVKTFKVGRLKRDS